VGHRRRPGDDAVGVNGSVGRPGCKGVGQDVRGDVAERKGVVAEEGVDFADAGALGGEQHAFQETLRITLEVPAVLERARLTLVDIDRHQARLGLGGDALPLAADREARAKRLSLSPTKSLTLPSGLSREALNPSAVPALPPFQHPAKDVLPILSAAVINGRVFELRKVPHRTPRVPATVGLSPVIG